MKKILSLSVLILSFVSIVRGAEDQISKTERTITIDWVKHPGAKVVIAGVETFWGHHCYDNLKIIPKGDFSDTNGDKWKQTGVNTGDENIWDIDSVFSYVNVDAGKIGKNTVTCNLKLKDGTKFTATYDFETVERENVVVGPEKIRKTNKRLVFTEKPTATGKHEFTLTNDITFIGSHNFSATETLPITVADGERALIYAWDVLKCYTITTTTFRDDNGDGFPEGAPDVSTREARDFFQTTYELTSEKIPPLDEDRP